MSKMIKTTDTEVKVDTSTTLVVEIGELCFEVDERFPWINVYKIADFVKKEFITEIDEDDMPVFVEHEELQRYCLNWYFNNVEIIASENLERTAQEVPVQEQLVKLLEGITLSKWEQLKICIDREFKSQANRTTFKLNDTFKKNLEFDITQ